MNTMLRYFGFLSLPLFALDQWTKWLIVTNFADPTPPGIGDPPIPVIPGFTAKRSRS